MAAYKTKMINYFSHVMMALLLIYAGTPITLCKAFQSRHFERMQISNETIPHIKMNENPKVSLTSCVLKCNEQEYCIGASVNELDGKCNVYGDAKYLSADTYDMKSATGHIWKIAMNSISKSCPPGFQDLSGSCFLAFPGTNQAWNDGISMCTMPGVNGFRLAEFHTTEAMQEFASHYSGFGSSAIFVGATLSINSGQFEWVTTNRPVDLFTITDGPGPTPKNCLFWTANGGFQTIKCDLNLGSFGYFFACEAHYIIQ